MKRATLFGAILASLLGGVNDLSAGTYNAAADFSITSNPNGVWSYGSSVLLSPDIFSEYTQKFVNGFGSGINGWGAAPVLGGNPSVFNNPTSSAITFGTLTLDPHELAFHPGPNGEISIVRFTAPAAGTYNISTAFRVDDLHGPRAGDEVDVLKNGVVIDSGTLGRGYHDSLAFSQTVTLAFGGTLDFAVGDSGGSNYDNNTTGIAADLSVSTPEPASMTLLCLGIAGMAGYGWKKRQPVLAS